MFVSRSPPTARPWSGSGLGPRWVFWRSGPIRLDRRAGSPALGPELGPWTDFGGPRSLATTRSILLAFSGLCSPRADFDGAPTWSPASSFPVDGSAPHLTSSPSFFFRGDNEPATSSTFLFPGAFETSPASSAPDDGSSSLLGPSPAITNPGATVALFALPSIFTSPSIFIPEAFKSSPASSAPHDGSCNETSPASFAPDDGRPPLLDFSPTLTNPGATVALFTSPLFTSTSILNPGVNEIITTSPIFNPGAIEISPASSGPDDGCSPPPGTSPTFTIPLPAGAQLSLSITFPLSCLGDLALDSCCEEPPPCAAHLCLAPPCAFEAPVFTPGPGAASPGAEASPRVVEISAFPPAGNTARVAPPRSSARLLHQAKESALGRAMRRKARTLGDGDYTWTSSKVKTKSLLCGVKLSDAESKELCQLLRGDA